MNSKKFKELCEKYGVKLWDLPAFPKKELIEKRSDKEWKEIIKNISKVKYK